MKWARDLPGGRDVEGHSLCLFQWQPGFAVMGDCFQVQIWALGSWISQFLKLGIYILKKVFLL